MNTILVIEDNKEIRENVCELLQLEGYNVLFAVNGKLGLALAKESHPDLILCDIWMPEMGGYEVFNDLKKEAATSTIPFVFVTASADRREVEIGLNMGAHAYIRKPFQEQELFDTIKECLKIA